MMNIYSFMPVLVMGVGFFLIYVLVEGVLYFDKKKKRRHPITTGYLRGPGYSLRNEVDDLRFDVIGRMMLLVIMPVLLYSMYINVLYFQGGMGQLSLPIMVAMFVGLFLYIAVKLAKDRNRLHSLRLGLDGETAVGQELNILVAHGFSVFHDFPADGFNIDHVAVGPTGVFAVETKGRSKPDRGRGREDAKVIYDGKSLQFPLGIETRPIEQARSQAKWLKDWLTKAAGEQVVVTPVLTIPGWYVDPRGKSDVVVFNGKNPDKFLHKYRTAVLDEGQIRRINYQLDQKCRISDL